MAEIPLLWLRIFAITRALCCKEIHLSLGCPSAIHPFALSPYAGQGAKRSIRPLHVVIDKKLSYSNYNDYTQRLVSLSTYDLIACQHPDDRGRVRDRVRRQPEVIVNWLAELATSMA